MNKKHITVFDFDGTLTLSDSMMEIILFQRGRMGLVWALLRQVHLIILMFARIYSNQKTKERLLAYCFGGMTTAEWNDFSGRFAESRHGIMNPEMVARLNEATQRGDMVFVITASPVEWVARFVPGTTVIGSHLEIVNGIITGRLASLNCYGQEKVNRLLEQVSDLKEHRENYHITAYGDSRGDREMLAFADEGILL